MCLERINELLTNPVSAISRAKKEKELKTTLLILLFEWFLIGISALILLKRVNTAVIGFFFGIVATLFSGFLTQIVFTCLGGKGRYFEGLTSNVYSILPISAASVLSSIFLYLPGIGVLLSFITFAIFTVLGLSILYKSVKELFSTDMVSSLVGINILIAGVIFALYFAFLQYAALQGEFLFRFSQFLIPS